MDFDKDWTPFALEAEESAFGMTRIAKTYNAARQRIVALEAKLATAERERDEARADMCGVLDAVGIESDESATEAAKRNNDGWEKKYLKAERELAEAPEGFVRFTSRLQAENEELKQRAERAESILRELRAWLENGKLRLGEISTTTTYCALALAWLDAREQR